MNITHKIRAPSALRIAVISAILLVVAGSSLEARAQNFSPTNTGWQGLSDFVSAAQEQDVEVNISDALDWSALSPKDVLLFVHPTSAIDVDNAARFAVDGGKMLIAIESDAQTELLERLGIQVHQMGEAQREGASFVQDNPALPIFKPYGQHPLLDGVSHLVANHPAVLVNVGGPVVAYPDGAGLVYDMNLGEGKVLVFGDASLFINQMQHVADNARLGQNALDYLCAGQDPCQLHLITKRFGQRGNYDFAGEPDEPTTKSWSRWFAELNALLQDFMSDLPITRLLYYLAILLAAGLGLYLAAVFRLRAGRPYSEHIRPTGRDAQLVRSEYDWNLARFGRGGRETNFALPLAILKELFEELFLEALGFWPIAQDQRPTIPQLGAAFRAKYLAQDPHPERAEREVIDLLATYAAIPTRQHIFMDSDAYYSERDLIRIYRNTRRVLRRMGLEEAYERRTQSLV